MQHPAAGLVNVRTVFCRGSSFISRDIGHIYRLEDCVVSARPLSDDDNPYSHEMLKSKRLRLCKRTQFLMTVGVVFFQINT